jgi:exosortase A-associated hydrolase 1/exosortase A-associated hydrolase 2
MPPAPLAFFLVPDDGRGGQRFCLYHPPLGPVVRGGVSYLAPLAEEMNKSRRMAAMQARALAGAGYAVLQMDLLGCGDSSGDFGDASWADWIADVECGLRWLRAQLDALPVASAATAANPAPLWLWGLRAGCLLAAEVTRRAATPPNLLFWQPAASGKTVLQQFLRLRLAGDLLASRAQGAMAALRDELAAGRAVEVAGYRLAPALASGLGAATLEPPALMSAAASAATSTTASHRLAWLELSMQPAAGLSLPAASLLARWREAGSVASGGVVPGPAFWQTAEIELAPELPGASLAALEEGAGRVHPMAATGAAIATPHAAAARGDTSAGPCLETAAVFACAGDSLIGVLALPAAPLAPAATGVLIVVGGPQVRAGSHRQFVLLARALAGAGYATLRFDLRGMGDSSGEPRGFEHLAVEVAAGARALRDRVPAITRVVLWGLCDGASAALLGLPETGIAGLVLVNPWVRTEAGQARTALRHYYPQRLRQADFWAKLLRGRVARGAVAGALRSARRAWAAPASSGEASSATALATSPTADDVADYTRRMASAWRRFPGPLLLLLSGRDHTAQEFIDHATRDPAWAGLLQRPGVERHDLPEADHTLSAAADEARATTLTIAWLRQLPPSDGAVSRAAELVA